MSQLFASGGQSFAASASVLPVSIQFISFRIGWVVLLTVRGILKGHLCSTTIRKHHSVLNDATHTSVHDYWKNHSFDSADLCHQSDVSAF